MAMVISAKSGLFMSRKYLDISSSCRPEGDNQDLPIAILQSLDKSI